MQIIRTLETAIDALSGGSVVTIGNFDGLHTGHQQLLQSVFEKSEALGLPSVVVSFEPTPQEYFRAMNPPARLMRFAEKCQALDDKGVDVFCCLTFDAAFSERSAEWFIQQILVRTLNVRHLVVGDHFRFGNNRDGDVELLKRAGESNNFQVSGITDFEVDGVTVSSTLIRQALASGNLKWAAELLGRRYRMSGEVIHGNHLGRRLGFPTANIDPDRLQVALMGIFAVRAYLGEKILEGVASIGTRPTIGGTKMLLEVFIFDFDEDIYGRELEVEFVEKIRDELNFPDIDALIEHMNKDVASAKKILRECADA